MTPRGRMVAFLAVIALTAGAVGGRAAASRHVRSVTGQEPESVSCLRCHGPASGTTYVRAQAHPDPRRFAVSPDGSRLFVTCGPVDAVAEIDVAAGTLVRRAPVTGRPRDVAISPDGTIVAVSLEGTDEVALLDGETLEESVRISVGAGPAGMAFGEGGRLLFVANRLAGSVSVIDVQQRRETYRADGGREPYAVVSSPGGAHVAVLSRSAEVVRPDDLPACEVTFFEAATGTVSRRVALPSCHMAEDLVYTPDGRRLLVPAIRVRNLLPIVQVARGWVMSSVLAVIDTEDGDVSLLPLNEQNTGFPDPCGVAVTNDGRTAWVAAAGSDEICEIDLDAAFALENQARPHAPERQSMTRGYVRRRVPVGANPRDVAVCGGTVAVAERLDDRVALLRPDGTFERVAFGPDVEPDDVRRGERVFHDARYAFQQSFSCRSCHPDGHTDGLTYDFDIDGVGRNVLLNRSLHGVKGTAPFKWSGLNPSLERQCGARFAMVLTRADPFPDEQLNQLTEYLRSLPPPRPHPEAGSVAGRDGGAVERGARLFERSRQKDGTPIPPAGRCVTCHPPPHYSNFLDADVGTGGPRDSKRVFDVPHLTGVASKAPYLHDGRATSLEAIWTAPGVGDRHGVVTDLGKTELNDLIAFLRGL